MIRLLLRSLCVASVMACSAMPSAHAEPRAKPAGDPNRTPIETLISRLGDASYRVREAAGRELHDRGEEALPALRQARMDGTSPELRRRVAVLTQSIERGVLLSPKRVNLTLTKRPFEEAVKEIARQTGYDIEIAGSVEGHVTLDLRDATYWEAIDRLSLAGGLTYGWDDSEQKVRLYVQDTYSPFVTRSGPFRIVANNVHSNRTVNLSDLPRRGNVQNMNPEYLQFSFSIYSEPKIPILSVGTPTLTEALDQDGHSLKPRDNNEYGYGVGYYPGNVYRSFQQQSQVMLHRSSRDSTQMKVIRGKVPLTLLSEQRPDVVIDKIGSIKKGKFEGVTAEIHVDGVELNGTTLSMNINVLRKGTHDRNDHSWVNSVHQRLMVEDAEGNLYYTQIQNYMNMSPQQLHAAVSFVPSGGNGKKVGPPVKLTFVRWVTMEHLVEFEFENIPLP